MAYKRDNNQQEYEEKVITISRVSKKTKGGDQMSFTALMVVGDGLGKVGVGLGKAKDVNSAIQKGIKQAKRKMITVPIDHTTIPFEIVAEHGAGKVLLKPASKGSGVIAGGPVRAVVEAAGIKDISAKILGSDNQASSVHATFKALKKIKNIIKVRGIKVEQDKPKKEELVQQSAPSQVFSKVSNQQKQITKKTIKKKVENNSIKAKIASKKLSAEKKLSKTNKVAEKNKVSKSAKTNTK